VERVAGEICGIKKAPAALTDGASWRWAGQGARPSESPENPE